jgi:hypothetical protein
MLLNTHYTFYTHRVNWGERRLEYMDFVKEGP